MYEDSDKIENSHTKNNNHSYKNCNKKYKNKIENDNINNVKIIDELILNKKIKMTCDSISLKNKSINNTFEEISKSNDKISNDKISNDKISNDKISNEKISNEKISNDKISNEINFINTDKLDNKITLINNLNSDNRNIDYSQIIPFTKQIYNKNISTFIRLKDDNFSCKITKQSLNIENKTYYADHIIMGPNQTQVFDLIQHIILENAIKGYNCSIFAYGQTGSGKTYTIQGTKENPGIIIQTLKYLHRLYQSLRFSFVEIYNEHLIDLFDPERIITIREDSLEGVVVSNSTIIESENIEKSISDYERGLMNRRTASTEMNTNSSRSHCIFTIFLGFRDHGITKKSRLCIVDLAGSEKYREGIYERMKETCNINKSLLCLGKIVNKLSSGDSGHISYRDSKLTFILKDALGGNSKLAIIGNISLQSVWDTINTLMFLQRCKLLNNNPLINYGSCESSVSELMENLKMLDEENVNLKEEIKMLQKINQKDMSKSTNSFVKELLKNVVYIKKKINDMKKIIEEFNFEDYDIKRKILMEINENLIKKNIFENEEIKKLSEKNI